MRLFSKVVAATVLLNCAPLQAQIQAQAAAAASLPIIVRAPHFVQAPNVLGTVAQPIRADRFASSLRQAFADASTSPLLQRLIAPARRLTGLQQIGYVQSAVARNIHWISDATEWGQHDYWASASQTLARGAGDEEDRAIVKMQALRALGFNQSDLFLTLARDRVGGPMTVLMARINGRYFVLDDTGGTPFQADQRRFEFQPVISFGWNGTWVHTRPPAALARVASASTTFGHK
jgi:predicted transglutaminase-like cysteine proteinase